MAFREERSSPQQPLQPVVSLPALRKLCTVLKNEGNRVLNGASSFTLTTDVLINLNTECRRHSISESEDSAVPDRATSNNRSFLTVLKVGTRGSRKLKVEWGSHVQFVKDFMLSTPSLKVLHNCCTLSSPISLSRFGNLTFLELRKVPIHMVESLYMLRGSLKTLVVYHCLEKLKDLLEACGGDMSAPMTWSELTAVSLNFNNISELDDSLRLLPHLEILDLSHNVIESCDPFLETLGDVQKMTLSFNCLTSIPSVSMTTRASLMFLGLRGNNLDNLKGLQELVLLQELDLGENCLSDHMFLNPLVSLTRLRHLQLDGNPIFYHRLHRPLTASCLARKAMSTKFVLDRRKLTVGEITYFRQRPQRPQTGASAHPRSEPTDPNRDEYLSASSGIGTENDSAADSEISRIKRKRSKRKRLKARTTEIQDLETSGDYSSQDGTPAGSPRSRSLLEQMEARQEEARQTKREVEELRRLYGPNWLQAIQDKNIFNKTRKTPDWSTENSASDTDGLERAGTSSFAPNLTKSRKLHLNFEESTDNPSDATDGEMGKIEPVPTEDDLYLKETVNPIMFAIAKLASGQSGDETEKEKRGHISTSPCHAACVASSPKLTNAESSVEQRRSDRDSDQLEKLNVEKEKGGSTLLEESQSEASSQVEQPLDSFSKRSRLAMDLKKNEKDLMQQIGALSPIKSSDSESPGQRSSAGASVDRSISEVDSSAESSRIVLDEQEVTESMFVSLPLQEGKMVIVSLTENLLVEKDIGGKITEVLDLSALTKLDSQSKTNGTDTKEGESVQLELKFDYVRKDRQSRCYLMDSADGQILINYLQPFWDRREEKLKAQMMVVMQCLKCNRTFLKSELLQKTKILPTSGSSKDLQAIKELMGKMTLMCPKCSSSIIIELDPMANLKATGSGTSTPVGSHSSTGSFMDQFARKPKPLLKRQSFDHMSPQASLAAKLSSRKNSLGSVDLLTSPLSRKGSNTGSASGAAGSWARDSQSRTSSVSSNRERSNAFSATGKMGHGGTNNGNQSIPSESEELIYVEDHFTKEAVGNVTSSQQLAIMTESLRDDSTSRGRSASVRRSLALTPPRFEQRKTMVDSGFESGVDSTVADQAGSMPINIGHKRGQQIGSRSESLRSSVVSVGDNEGGGEAGKKGEDDARSQAMPKRVDTYTSLAAMADIVDAMVSEGQVLDEKNSEFCEDSEDGGRRRSVSITLFRKSSLMQPRSNVATPSNSAREEDKGLQHSASGSSITILPSPGFRDEFHPASLTHGDGAQVLPVTFAIGTPEAESSHISLEKNKDTVSTGRMTSPLNSEICSSMVSSIYETSVTAQESDAMALAKGPGESAPSQSAAPDSGTPVILIGSSDSAKSASEEDLTSIYDRPRKIKSVKRADVAGAADMPGSTSTSSDQLGDGGQRSDFVIRPGWQKDDGSPVAATGRSVAAVAGFDDDDHIDSELERSGDSSQQDGSPQFAFHHLNHRLTLFLMMGLFGNDEDFICKIQGEITQYIIEEPYPGILVMTSMRFYVLKITSDDHSKEPSEWLTCVEIQPVPELSYIDVGLGGQSLRLEFHTECSSYTLVTRNRDMTAQFVELLHTHLAKYAVSQGILSQVVVNEDVDQSTLDNLDRDVVSKIQEEKLLLYCMGFIERGHHKLFPVSFVVTSSDICLVRTNHQWPQPRLQPDLDVDTVGKQFTVLERQKVNNIAIVEVCEVTMKKLRLQLFSEIDGISANWNITMPSRQSLFDFINALSEPWSKEFGVEMEIAYTELKF